jgi:hypothetical protein
VSVFGAQLSRNAYSPEATVRIGGRREGDPDTGPVRRYVCGIGSVCPIGAGVAA